MQMAQRQDACLRSVATVFSAALRNDLRAALDAFALDPVILPDTEAAEQAAGSSSAVALSCLAQQRAAEAWWHPPAVFAADAHGHGSEQQHGEWASPVLDRSQLQPHCIGGPCAECLQSLATTLHQALQVCNPDALLHD